MQSQTRIGMITPSLNTVLEPVTYALLSDLPDVTAHFSRVRVTHISLGDDATSQFADEPMLAAARMLADARVHAICWNGTAGSWLGPDFDRRLCEAIARETGIPATSATLALTELFRSRGIKRFALVTPFEDALQEAIIETYGREGFECVAERHLDSDDTFGYATIPAAETEGMIRAVVGCRARGDRRRLYEPEGRAPRRADRGGSRPPGLRQRGGGALGHARARRRRSEPRRRLGRDLLRRARFAGAPRRPGVRVHPPERVRLGRTHGRPRPRPAAPAAPPRQRATRRRRPKAGCRERKNS